MIGRNSTVLPYADIIFEPDYQRKRNSATAFNFRILIWETSQDEITTDGQLFCLGQNS